MANNKLWLNYSSYLQFPFRKGTSEFRRENYSRHFICSRSYSNHCSRQRHGMIHETVCFKAFPMKNLHPRVNKREWAEILSGISLKFGIMINCAVSWHNCLWEPRNEGRFYFFIASHIISREDKEFLVFLCVLFSSQPIPSCLFCLPRQRS